MLKTEVKLLVILRVLERANNLECGSPFFAKPKPKKNRSNFLSEFRNLNKQLTHTMPKINEIILKLEGFKYTMLLDLNMGYYHIQLTEDVNNLCTIILPWGKYR